MRLPVTSHSHSGINGVDQRRRSRAGHGCDTDLDRDCNAAVQNLIRRNPSQQVKPIVVCVPVAQITRILVVGTLLVGVGVWRLPLSGIVPADLRRRNACRRQHDSRCEDSGDFVGHVVLHSHLLPPL